MIMKLEYPVECDGAIIRAVTLRPVKGSVMRKARRFDDIWDAVLHVASASTGLPVQIIAEMDFADADRIIAHITKEFFGRAAPAPVRKRLN